jgi:uncharacterized membrane protein
VRLSIRVLLIAGATTWCAALFAAPVFNLSPVYEFFSAICHQQSARSWHIHGEPLAVCIRCASIYIGFLAGLLAFVKPNPRAFTRAAMATAAQWLLAVSVIDLVSLRVLTGVLLGAYAAPIVRTGVEQLFARRVRTANESM